MILCRQKWNSLFPSEPYIKLRKLFLMTGKSFRVIPGVSDAAPSVFGRGSGLATGLPRPGSPPTSPARSAALRGGRSGEGRLRPGSRGLLAESRAASRSAPSSLRPQLPELWGWRQAALRALPQPQDGCTDAPAAPWLPQPRGVAGSSEPARHVPMGPRKGWAEDLQGQSFVGSLCLSLCLSHPARSLGSAAASWLRAQAHGAPVTLQDTFHGDGSFRGFDLAPSGCVAAFFVAFVVFHPFSIQIKNRSVSDRLITFFECIASFPDNFKDTAPTETTPMAQCAAPAIQACDAAAQGAERRGLWWLTLRMLSV